MKTFSVTLLIILVHHFQSNAQLVMGDPEKAGFSKTGFDRLNNIVQQYVDSLMPKLDQIITRLWQSKPGYMPKLENLS